MQCRSEQYGDKDLFYDDDDLWILPSPLASRDSKKLESIYYDTWCLTDTAVQCTLLIYIGLSNMPISWAVLWSFVLFVGFPCSIIPSKIHKWEASCISCPLSLGFFGSVQFVATQVQSGWKCEDVQCSDDWLRHLFVFLCRLQTSGDQWNIFYALRVCFLEH